MLPFLVIQPAHPGLLFGALALGFVVGVFGHIYKSQRVVILSIVLIGAISVYFVIFFMVPSHS